MTPDGELLRRYTETNSESAFAELVQRHLNLVYSAALRQVNGDAHLAQDVAQMVFADLARKAGSLARRPVLTGWLYTSAHFAATKVVRTERRRHARETEAQLMNQLLSDAAPNLDWEKLRPVLDAVMLELTEGDREAVLLRYFDDRPHAEIAERLGLSENAARMRVERALERLRTLLVRRGVSTTTAALSAVISANAVQVAPAGLATTLSTAALAGTTLTTAATTAATKAIAMTTLQKTLIAATLVVAVGTGIYEARQAAALREQNQTLQRLQAPLAEQNERLAREHADATHQLAALRDENERLNRNSAELLRLRGEVAGLRRQITESVNKNEKSGERGGRSDEPQDLLESLPPIAWEGEAGQISTNKFYAMKSILAAIRVYAIIERNNVFPTDFKQIANKLPGGFRGNVTLDDFEFISHALPLNDRKNPDAIVARERVARQAPNGQWARIYGFVDGHAAEHVSADGNFELWEAQHVVLADPSRQ